VGRHRVARENVPIDQRDVVSLPGEQQRRRCTGRAGADYNDVVIVTGRVHADVSTGAATAVESVVGT
jgi:hypothetical protein